jgi:endonuclease-3
MTAAKRSAAKQSASKRPFDIDLVMRRVRAAVRPFAKAAMFELAEDGFNSPFEQLVACVISIRTFDEVTIPTARKLFARARTPEEVSRLSAREIDRLIHACTFHERKAQQIRRIARRVVEEYGGEAPCEAEALMSFEGVGPKCANLVLGIACDQPRVSVDVHVYRVTRRWGYVNEPSPERASAALEAKLPRRYWVEINRLLVPFGKHICAGTLPRCSECPVLEFCQQVGVEKHR